MLKTPIPDRHTAAGGIHGEWSNRFVDRPIKKSDLFWAAVALGSMYLVLCVGAAAGF